MFMKTILFDTDRNIIATRAAVRRWVGGGEGASDRPPGPAREGTAGRHRPVQRGHAPPRAG